MVTPDLLAIPAMRLFAVVALLLVLKMVAVGSYTSLIRIRRGHYATAEDYTWRGTPVRTGPDEDIERVRRAHQNDLENILPFFAVGFLYALTEPGPILARIYLWGFFAARVLHSIFYIRGMQPHRTIAFGVGLTLMLLMLGTTLATLL
jgi:prostaglandin-E synthase 1